MSERKDQLRRERRRKKRAALKKLKVGTASPSAWLDPPHRSIIEHDGNHVITRRRGE